MTCDLDAMIGTTAWPTTAPQPHRTPTSQPYTKGLTQGIVQYLQLSISPASRKNTCEPSKVLGMTPCTHRAVVVHIHDMCQAHTALLQ